MCTVSMGQTHCDEVYNIIQDIGLPKGFDNSWPLKLNKKHVADVVYCHFGQKYEGVNNCTVV